MALLQWVLILLAATAAWALWRVLAYPGAPFRADLADLRRRLHRTRIASWGVVFKAGSQTSLEVDERAARQPYEQQATHLRAQIKAAKSPGTGPEVARLPPLVLYERVLHRTRAAPASGTSAEPDTEPATPPQPVALPLQGITHDISHVRGEDELTFVWPNGEHTHYSLPLPISSAQERTDFLNDLYAAAKALPALLQEDQRAIKSLQQRLGQAMREADEAAAEARQQHGEKAAQLTARRTELRAERETLHAEWAQKVGRAPRC